MSLSAGETDPKQRKRLIFLNSWPAAASHTFPNSQMWKHSISHEMIKMLQLIKSLLPALISIATVSESNQTAALIERKEREAE